MQSTERIMKLLTSGRSKPNDNEPFHTMTNSNTALDKAATQGSKLQTAGVNKTAAIKQSYHVCYRLICCSKTEN